MSHPYNTTIATQLTHYITQARTAKILETRDIRPYSRTTSVIRDSPYDIGTTKGRNKLLASIEDPKVRKVVDALSKLQKPKTVEQLVSEATGQVSKETSQVSEAPSSSPNLRVARDDLEERTA